MTPTITIPTTALHLLHLPGYIARYQHYLGEGKSCPAAWEAVEAELFGYFEVNRYKNYETFKATLTRFQQKRVKNG
jgi:hypothetical protein